MAVCKGSAHQTTDPAVCLVDVGCRSAAVVQKSSLLYQQRHLLPCCGGHYMASRANGIVVHRGGWISYLGGA